jgi:hypothetical protein
MGGQQTMNLVQGPDGASFVQEYPLKRGTMIICVTAHIIDNEELVTNFWMKEDGEWKRIVFEMSRELKQGEVVTKDILLRSIYEFADHPDMDKILSNYSVFRNILASLLLAAL